MKGTVDAAVCYPQHSVLVILGGEAHCRHVVKALIYDAKERTVSLIKEEAMHGSVLTGVAVWSSSTQIPALLREKVTINDMCDCKVLTDMAQMNLSKELTAFDIFRDLSFADMEAVKRLSAFATEIHAKCATSPDWAGVQVSDIRDLVSLVELPKLIINGPLKKAFMNATDDEEKALHYIHESIKTQMASALYIYQCNSNGFSVDAIQMENAITEMGVNLVKEESRIRKMYRSILGWVEGAIVPKVAPAVKIKQPSLFDNQPTVVSVATPPTKFWL